MRLRDCFNSATSYHMLLRSRSSSSPMTNDLLCSPLRSPRRRPKECSAGAALGVQEGASEPGNTYDAGGESHARNIASVFREFEVDVRPEPPPAPIAPGGRPAEETLAAQMDLTGL